MQRKQVSTSAAKDALVVETGAGCPGADLSGLASRNAGLWVVGAPIGAPP
jgi:phosphoribosylcarboxyaminoimidazole (NCAIR) mutase